MKPPAPRSRRNSLESGNIINTLDPIMAMAAPSTPSNDARRTVMSQQSPDPARLGGPPRAVGAHETTPEIGAADGIETLYVHPNSKVVKFFATPNGGSRPGTSGSFRSPLSPGEQREGAETGGTLPWTTSSEQTLAVGPLEIYRVPGSVSFVRSNSLLHAILPRTQCWCVDGVSIFVVRVAIDTYYRIELPGAQDSDLEKVEQFKFVLQRVLHYERTPCPFARGFTVDLPDEPRAERRRRRTTHGPAKKWKLARAYTWRPEDGGEPPADQGASEESPEGSAQDTDEDPGEEGDDDEEEEELLDSDEGRILSSPGATEDSGKVIFPAPARRPTVRERVAGFTNSRSFTAPPQIKSHASVPLRTEGNPALQRSLENDARQGSYTDTTPAAHVSTPDRSFQNILTAMPPSPPESSAGCDQTEPIATSSHDEVEAQQNERHDHSTQPKGSTTPVAIASSKQDQESRKEIRNTFSAETELDANPSPETLPAETVPPLTMVSELTESEREVGRERERQQRQEEDVDAEEEEAEETEAEAEAAKAEAEEAQVEAEDGNQKEQLERKLEPGIPKVAPKSYDKSYTSPSQIIPAIIEHDVETSIRPSTTPKPDPYAEIQARINARRSIGSSPSITTPPPLHSRSSRLISHHRRISTKPSIPVLAQHLQHQRQHSALQSLAVARFQRAYEVFYAWAGPPKHLAEIMLRIAARMADGAVEGLRGFKTTPRKGEIQRVPGSFDLEEEGWEGEDEEDSSQQEISFEEIDAPDANASE